ncbi:MAG: molybdopterin-dependent oxidoreductase [Chloroflexi bacterium]|nr:molybdopterin-dependent oxidoreductase [Chloroflexota bacterium]
MTNSIGDVEAARAILIVGSNTTEQHPVIGLAVKRAVRKGGAKLIVADPRTIELAGFADVHLRHRPGTDLALLNGLAHVIVAENRHRREFIEARTEGFDEWRAAIGEYPPERVSEMAGVPAADIIRAARLYADNLPAAILYAMGITQHVCGHQNVLAVANLALLTGNIGLPGSGVNPLRGQNNVQGACDMGALPNVFSGYQSVSDSAARGKFVKAWGRIPESEKPGLTVIEMIGAAGSGNIFLNETTNFAHVVLPAASFAEKDGTFTNTERRVQRVRKAINPPGEAKADWEIICEIANRLSHIAGNGRAAWTYADPAEILQEIASLTPSYGGISFDRLEASYGLQWPCPTPDHPGTPILHTERFTRGRGKFSVVHHVEQAEQPDVDYPLTLTTGRRLQQYHTGTMTRRAAGPEFVAPEELVEINPADAATLGVADGGWVTVASRRGEVRARAWVTDRPRPGVVFMTFHFVEALGNVLTNPALDPVAKIPEYKVCAVKVSAALN